MSRAWVPLLASVSKASTRTTSSCQLRIFSPRISGYLVPAEVTDLISEPMQSKEAARVGSADKEPESKRHKEYLSPLRPSLRDLGLLELTVPGSLLMLKGILSSCYAGPDATHLCTFWMLLLKDKRLLKQIKVRSGDLY